MSIDFAGRHLVRSGPKATIMIAPLCALHLDIVALRYVVDVRGYTCVCAYPVLLHLPNQLGFCQIVWR